MRIDKAHVGTPRSPGRRSAGPSPSPTPDPTRRSARSRVTDTIEAPTTFVSAARHRLELLQRRRRRHLRAHHVARHARLRRVVPGRSPSPSRSPRAPRRARSCRTPRTVTARTFDPLLANNTDTDTATVTTSADLAIAKTHSGPVVAGQDATYTLDVTNHGPSVSIAPITVVDTLPAGSTFVSAAGTGWVCTPGTGTVSCTSSTDLAPGAAAPQIVVAVAIPSAQTGDGRQHRDGDRHDARPEPGQQHRDRQHAGRPVGRPLDPEDLERRRSSPAPPRPTGSPSTTPDRPTRPRPCASSTRCRPASPTCRRRTSSAPGRAPLPARSSPARSAVRSRPTRTSSCRATPSSTSHVARRAERGRHRDEHGDRVEPDDRPEPHQQHRHRRLDVHRRGRPRRS